MWVPVGPWLTIGASPVRATHLRSDGLAEDFQLKAHAILFQACPANAGVLYIFDRPDGDVNGVTTGMCGMISCPTYNVGGVPITLPWCTVGIPSCPDAFNVPNFWVHGSHAGDHCAVSRIVW